MSLVSSLRALVGAQTATTAYERELQIGMTTLLAEYDSMIDRHGDAAEALARHFLEDRKSDRELIAGLVARVKELQQQLPTIEQAMDEPIDRFVASFSEVMTWPPL